MDEKTYRDGRPSARLRMPAVDEGVVLRRDSAPDNGEQLCIREASIVADGGRFVLLYDDASADGWRACAATSRDLREWERHGRMLELGDEGSADAAMAGSPWVIAAGGRWHMFYMGCPTMWEGSPEAVGPFEPVPDLPYVAMKAVAPDLLGPWRKDPACVPFRPRPGTFYEAAAGAGAVVRAGGEYLQFFSAAVWRGDVLLRTLGLAHTRDLNGPWSVDPEPIVPLAEQIENSSVYVDAEAGRYWLFTNHIGIDDDGLEYTDAVWVYWSDDPTCWSPEHKAVVLDGSNCGWSSECIGMPTVAEFDGRLALLYDAPGGSSKSHVGRDIGLAWLELPLHVPA